MHLQKSKPVVIKAYISCALESNVIRFSNSSNAMQVKKSHKFSFIISIVELGKL